MKFCAHGKKAAKSPILFVALAVIVIIIALVLFTGSRKADPTEYLDVTFTGLSGQGKCVADLDKDRMFESALGVDTDAIGSMEALGKYIDQLQSFYEDISISVSPKTGLSNGDVVEVTITCTGEAAKHFKSVSTSETVSGLTETTEIDPFEDIEISYSGINGSAEILFKNNKNDEIMDWVTFVVDPQYDLSTGDEVTITAKLPEETSLKTGYTLSQTTKTVVVPELGEYLTDPTDIPESLIQDILDYYIPKYTWASTETRIYDTPQHYGSYFLVFDEPGFYTPVNQLVVWLYFDNKLVDGTQMPTEYISIKYNNIIINPDGTFNILVQDGYDYDSAWPLDIEYEVSSLKNTNYGVCYELTY